MQKMVNWLIGTSSKNPLKIKTVHERFTVNEPSFSDLFSMVEFNEEKKVFLLNDGISVGSGFELGDIPSEAISEKDLESIFNKVYETFANVMPLHQQDPWVMQFFVQDEFNLEPALNHLKKTISQDLLDDPFTQDYLARLGDLYQKSTQPDGLFLDPRTGKPFRGRRRRLRLLCYRRYQQIKVTREFALTEHESVIQQVMEKLLSPGLSLKRLTGKGYYQWWVKWFNPNPIQCEGKTDKLLEQFPYPSKKPAGFSFPQNILFSTPQSNGSGFLFDGLIHRSLYVDGLKESPEIGLLSRERKQANPKHFYAMLDQLPEGAIFTTQIIFRSDESLDKHLQRLEKGVIGTSLKPQSVKADIKRARDELSLGNRLFWVNQAVLYRAEDEQKAQVIEQQLLNLFFDNKMPLIPSQMDLHPLNSYLNALPFNFIPSFASKYLCYERLMYASELACLLPVYGRNQGSKHLPCLPFFNRLGEPVFYDILHSAFVSQNSHLAIFANSGSGKSVLTGWLICTLMALKNARVVVFEMGNSFDRLLVHCKSKGKHVKQLLLSKQKDKAVPLNPFSDAYKAIPEIQDNLSAEQAERLAIKLRQFEASLHEEANIQEMACNDESRSYLFELSLALRTMITEANVIEEQAFSLADETLLIEILSDSIITSLHQNVPQMLTSHIVEAFVRRIEIEPIPRKKDRLQDMHDRLKSYVINADKSRFFNVPTPPLDSFDIFHVDVSAIKEDQGKLALVMISLLPRILALAEATQHDEQPIFLFIDEAHLQFDVDVIVSACLLIAKVARKLGLWLVPITQNVEDMKSQKAIKILSLIETWILLGINEKELQDVKQFKSLTSEQEELIRSISSQKGLYAEAVLLGSRYQGIFRVIPFRYLLALLINEKSEKAERHTLEQDYDVLQAAEIMAKRLETPMLEKMDLCEFYDD